MPNLFRLFLAFAAWLCAALIGIAAFVATEPPLTYILLGFAAIEIGLGIWLVFAYARDEMDPEMQKRPLPPEMGEEGAWDRNDQPFL